MDVELKGGGGGTSDVDGSGNDGTRDDRSISAFRFFDSPSVTDEIKRRIAVFLPDRDAISLSKTCKSVRSKFVVLSDLGMIAS
jgi:hypothetical protein